MIGGVLDFYFFSGPSPKSVIEQYGGLIGLPTWQPAWGFGFHLCRFGCLFLAMFCLWSYSNVRWGYNNISQTREQVTRMREANIPLEGTPYLMSGCPWILTTVMSSHVERYWFISLISGLYNRSCQVPTGQSSQVYRWTGEISPNSTVKRLTYTYCLDQQPPEMYVSTRKLTNILTNDNRYTNCGCCNTRRNQWIRYCE